MLNYDWENSIGFWICGTAQILKKQIGSELLSEGITFRQWEVLTWLSTSGGCGSQSELAEGLGIEPHTMAGVIYRMQRDGLLDRKSCDQDRRKNRIHPTPKSEEVWKRVAKISTAIRERAIRGFSDEEVTQLINFCERIQKNLGGRGYALPTARFEPDSIEISSFEAIEDAEVESGHREPAALVEAGVPGTHTRF